MQRQEGGAEAGGEGWRGFGYAALGAGQFGGKPGQEMVLRLVGGQAGDRRQDAERIGRQEDHFGSVTRFRHRLNNVVDVVDGVGDAGIFGL